MTDALPLYRQLAEALTCSIREGRYPVGSLLPGELELCQQYRASRHTVREALRLLQEKGLVLRRQGAGTTVIAARPRLKYNQYVSSITDLMRYGAETRFEILRAQRLKAGADIATLLDCPIGEQCLHLHGIRYDREYARPVCTTEVYRLASDATARQLEDLAAAVFILSNELDLERLGRVEQSFNAIVIGEAEASELGADWPAAALRSVRRYFDRDGRLLLAAVSIHPGHLFTYSTTLYRDTGG